MLRPDGSLDTGMIAIVLSILAFLWGVIRERGKPRLDTAQSKDLEERVRKSLETSLLDENKRLSLRITELEINRMAMDAELTEARQLIVELTERDKKREVAMDALKKEFDSDTLLRANVERMLAIANDRIKQLESDNLELSLRLTAVEKERAEEQAAWTTERRVWRDGIWKVIKQITDLNPGVVPAWRPPDTQPLGKFEGNL